MVKVKSRLVNIKDIPDDFYPDYIFENLIKSSSFTIIEVLFNNGFKFYFGTSIYLNCNSSNDIIKFLKEDYHLENLKYCLTLVNGAMNPKELQEYILRDENSIIPYTKCEKLWYFYRKYKQEINYVIEVLK
jgi:hypothetical protein